MLWILYFILRGNPGTTRRKGVHTLASSELLIFKLDVSSRDIVKNHISKDNVHGSVFRNLPCILPYYGSYFSFVIKPSYERRTYYVPKWWIKSCSWLYKYDRFVRGSKAGVSFMV